MFIGFLIRPLFAIFAFALLAPFIFMWFLVKAVWGLPWPVSWRLATLLAIFLIIVNFHP